MVADHNAFFVACSSKVQRSVYIVHSHKRLFCRLSAGILDIVIRQQTRKQLAVRRAKWTCPEPKIKTGYLARYAKMVSSADKGAILN